jgi:Ser/Thr protein kinase RdoA (MazF antagonist)
MKIYNTYRTRGAFILETDRGLKLLKNFEGSRNRVEFENALLEFLADQDYPYIDLYVRNAANEIITEDSSGNKYVLKNWFPGEECNLRDEADVEDAAINLANLHSLLREVPLTDEQVLHNSYMDLMEVFDKRNRELKRVRSYIREKRKKNDFEMCYMSCYDEFYAQAQAATRILEESDYSDLLKTAIDHRYVCHGNYTYHNVIMLKSGRMGYEKASSIGNSYGGSQWQKVEKRDTLSAAGIRKNMTTANMATTNFDKAYVGIQIMDLYHFMRKVMEKNDWDMDLGSMILDTYTSILPIDKVEQKLLYVLLLYPEKFWKITNFYYNGKKSWVPQRNIQKLVGIQEQAEQKSRFLECLKGTLT